MSGEGRGDIVCGDGGGDRRRGVCDSKGGDDTYGGRGGFFCLHLVLLFLYIIYHPICLNCSHITFLPIVVTSNFQVFAFNPWDCVLFAKNSPHAT